MMLRSLQNLLLSSPTQAVDNNARDNNSLNFFSLNKHRENEHVKARVPTVRIFHIPCDIEFMNINTDL